MLKSFVVAAVCLLLFAAADPALAQEPTAPVETAAPSATADAESAAEEAAISQPGAPAGKEEQVDAQPVPTASEPNRDTLIVLDPTNAQLSAQEVAAVSDRLAADLAKIPRFSVVNSADLRAMLELEANRQLLGCTDDSCLREIGDALGADIVLSWRFGNAGEQSLLSVTLFDTRSARAVGRAQQRLLRGGDVVQAASLALATALDQLYAAGRSSKAVAKETYRKESLYVAGINEARAYSRGQARVPIEPKEFYARVNRQDLVAAYEGFETAKSLLLWSPIVAGVTLTTVMGVAMPIAVVTLLGLEGGSFSRLDKASDWGYMGLTYAVAIGLGVLLTMPAVPVGVLSGLFLSNSHLPPESIQADSELARDHNRRLRRRLGVADVDVE